MQQRLLRSVLRRVLRGVLRRMLPSGDGCGCGVVMMVLRADRRHRRQPTRHPAGTGRRRPRHLHARG
eukprot:97858-Chlamydomonas_euryale.AAC.11